MKLLLLTKRTQWCDAAANFVKTNWPDSIVMQAERGEPIPQELGLWSGDVVISFLSSWIVPEATLKQAARAALNFHPAPPEYPGTGCYNFALYDGAAEYGVTCHEMAAKVDTGRIVKVVRFPMLVNDTVASLKERTMVHALGLFYEVLTALARKTPLPTSNEQWRRKPYVRRELEDLCRITPEMSAEEILRRIRATRFPGYPGPYIEVGGMRFDLKEES